MPFEALDVTGERYGRLVAIERVANRGRATFWLFQCDCGSEVELGLGPVRWGATKSCGCLSAEKLKQRSTRHGMHGTPTYVVWNSMKARCENPMNKRYADYGGRGISVCPEWSKSFEAFVRDMGVRPHGLTIDRIDNDGNYEPGNCRWTTKSEQRINQRGVSQVLFDGREYTVSGLADETGLSAANLRYRIRICGMSADAAVAVLRRGKWRRAK